LPANSILVTWGISTPLNDRNLTHTATQQIITSQQKDPRHLLFPPSSSMQLYLCVTLSIQGCGQNLPNESKIQSWQVKIKPHLPVWRVLFSLTNFSSPTQHVTAAVLFLFLFFFVFCFVFLVMTLGPMTERRFL
jgi:hypothetical protein